jgi:predicted nucleic acid-binding protein
MIAYIDSSVLMRVAFGQRNALPEWHTIDRGVSSALIITESLRTLDRLRMQAPLSDNEVARRRCAILALLDSLELVEIDSIVLDRAAQPMPTELNTLDAIHLASALLWQDSMGLDAVMATHDGALGLAAQAHGFKVLGI